MIWHRRREILIAGAVLAACFHTERAGAQWEVTREVTRVEETVLTRGPVHEAFAETVVFDPEPDLVVLRPPPEPIDEVPPAEAPDAEDVVWIPGYWAWDDEQNDYIWVSGVWRVVPPGRKYVPGYWSQVGHGFQWSSGFWIDVRQEEIEYVPEPPDTPKAGPAGPPPSPDHVWIPGAWIWDAGRYVWRPGTWAMASPEWVWVPAHYVWSPRGYVFVEGYWDYEIERRGILFAPVYFPPPVRVAAYTYTPTTVIRVEVFTDHLFVRPRYRHYYFGDYYAAVYTEQYGIVPWFAVHTTHIGYDPIYVHRRWRHRHEPDWENRIAFHFHYRREHEEARPPRTLDVQLRLGDREGDDEHRRLTIACSIRNLMERGDTRIRLRTLASEERENVVQRSRQVRQSREERRTIEREAKDDDPEPTRRRSPIKVRMPWSPIIDRGDSARARSTPSAPATMKTDPSIEPKPKKPAVKREAKPAGIEPPKADPTVAPSPRAAEPARTAPRAEPTVAPSPRAAEPAREAPRAEPRGTPRPPSSERAQPPRADEDTPKSKKEGERSKEKPKPGSKPSDKNDKKDKDRDDD